MLVLCATGSKKKDSKKHQSCDVIRDPRHIHKGTGEGGSRAFCHTALSNQLRMGESSMYTRSQTIFSTAKSNCLRLTEKKSHGDTCGALPGGES